MFVLLLRVFLLIKLTLKNVFSGIILTTKYRLVKCILLRHFFLCRLESLGALTHGDRRATETRDLSQFNIDNKYGRTALETTMKAIMGYEAPLVPPPKDYKGEFFKDVAGALVSHLRLLFRCTAVNLTFYLKVI